MKFFVPVVALLSVVSALPAPASDHTVEARGYGPSGSCPDNCEQYGWGFSGNHCVPKTPHCCPDFEKVKRCWDQGMGCGHDGNCVPQCPCEEQTQCWNQGCFMGYNHGSLECCDPSLISIVAALSIQIL